MRLLMDDESVMAHAEPEWVHAKIAGTDYEQVVSREDYDAWTWFYDKFAEGYGPTWRELT